MNYMGPQLYVPGSTLRRSTSASAADTRKRSLPSSSTDLASSSRHSFAARKSESDRDLFQQLVPVGVAFMEPISLDIAVTKDHADVRYVMNVHHTKTNTTWKHARSFDEYRRFQHKLLKTLNHGHFCNAECPWLFTFLKSYFPKKHLFHFTTARVIAARREALQRFFVTLQTFLLNKANHSCSVVAHGVVNDVVEFVYGSLASYYAPLDTSATTNSTNSITNCTNNQRNSFIKPRSSLTTVDDDDTSTSSGSTSCISPPWCCQLCESSLEGAAYATTRSGHSLASSEHSFLVDPEDPATSISASAPATCSVLHATSSPPNNRVVGTRRSTYYVTTLGCGHQFHDECIVPKLNETLRCPTCDHLEVK